MKHSTVEYFIKSADRHGTEILKHSNNKYYSPEEKLRIINRVLISNETILSVSIDEGLSNHGVLANWIKSYKENKYNVMRKNEEENQMTKKKTAQELLQENKALKEKMLILEVENLYLKKLDALIQKREQREKKKSPKQ